MNRSFVLVKFHPLETILVCKIDSKKGYTEENYVAILWVPPSLVFLNSLTKCYNGKPDKFYGFNTSFLGKKINLTNFDIEPFSSMIKNIFLKKKTFYLQKHLRRCLEMQPLFNVYVSDVDLTFSFTRNSKLNQYFFPKKLKLSNSSNTLEYLESYRKLRIL